MSACGRDQCTVNDAVIKNVWRWRLSKLGRNRIDDIDLDELKQILEVADHAAEIRNALDAIGAPR